MSVQEGARGYLCSSMCRVTRPLLPHVIHGPTGTTGCLLLLSATLKHALRMHDPLCLRERAHPVLDRAPKLPAATAEAGDVFAKGHSLLSRCGHREESKQGR